MNLSPMTAKFMEAFEQEYGRKPTELALQIAEHIKKVGGMLMDLGQKDARDGKKPYPADVFHGLVSTIFRNIPGEETAKEIAEIWQSDYMDGYIGP